MRISCTNKVLELLLLFLEPRGFMGCSANLRFLEITPIILYHWKGNKDYF